MSDTDYEHDSDRSRLSGLTVARPPAHMLLNEDILHLVSQFVDPSLYPALCCVSRSLHQATARRLYRSVRIRSADALTMLHATLMHKDNLAQLTRAFVEDLPPGYLLRAALPLRTELAERLSQILGRLSNLETTAFRAASVDESVRTQIVELVAEMRRMRNVRLHLYADGLPKFHSTGSRPLEYVSHLQFCADDTVECLRAHAASLRLLQFGSTGNLPTRFVAEDPTVIFPHVHTLRAPPQRVTAGVAFAFPAVRSLALVDPRSYDIGKFWPCLEHLELYDLRASPRAVPAAHHRITSLKFKYTGQLNFEVLVLLRAWASPHVRALALDWPRSGFGVHAAALRAYAGMNLLDVSLREAVVSWIQNIARLEEAPNLNLEVLTLRQACGLGDLTQVQVEALRVRFPALRLLRIIAEDDSRRVVYAWPRPLDWLSACELVADYFPHWRETHAPWEDIRDI